MLENGTLFMNHDEQITLDYDEAEPSDNDLGEPADNGYEFYSEQEDEKKSGSKKNDCDPIYETSPKQRHQAESTKFPIVTWKTPTVSGPCVLSTDMSMNYSLKLEQLMALSMTKLFKPGRCK